MSTLLVGSYILLWCLVLLLAATVLFLGRQVGSIYQRLGPIGARISNPGPELDSAIERTTMREIDGKEISIGGLRERRMLLIFLSPGCDSCEKLASGIRALSVHEKRSLDIVLVSNGPNRAVHQQFRRHHSLIHIPYILSENARVTFKIGPVPYAILLDESGVVRSKGMVNNLTHLESLVNTLDHGIRSLEDLHQPATPKALLEA